MNEISAILIVLAVVVANAGMYFILISACKREGVSVFTIFRPIEGMKILRTEDFVKLLLVAILVGILAYTSCTLDRVAN